MLCGSNIVSQGCPDTNLLLRYGKRVFRRICYPLGQACLRYWKIIKSGFRRTRPSSAAGAPHPICPNESFSLVLETLEVVWTAALLVDPARRFGVAARARIAGRNLPKANVECAQLSGRRKNRLPRRSPRAAKNTLQNRLRQRVTPASCLHARALTNNQSDPR